MTQVLHSDLSAASIGTSRILSSSPAASARQSPARFDSASAKELEAGLAEHRSYLEREVEQRTEQLVKRMELLESCNRTLCDKLAQAKRTIAALQKQLDASLSGSVAY